MPSRTPTLPEVLNALRDGVMRDLRVAVPGRIESFDADTNTADVQPLVKETVTNDDGTTSQVSLPVLTGVPVMFPSGGGMRITFPMAAGDTVLLIFGDRSLDAFLDQGSEAAPADQRRHSLSDAVAYPGLVPNNAAWTNIEADVITLGKDTGGNSDFVALAAKVKTEITNVRNTLNSLVSAHNGHTHPLTGVSITTTNAIVGSPCTATGSIPSGLGSISGSTSAPSSSASAPASVGDVKCTTVKVRD